MWKSLTFAGKKSYENQPKATKADRTYSSNENLNWSYYCGLDDFAGVWLHTGKNLVDQEPDWDINTDDDVVTLAHRNELTLQYLIAKSIEKLGISQGEEVVIHALMCTGFQQFWNHKLEENQENFDEVQINEV